MKHHRQYHRSLALALGQPGEIQVRNLGPAKVEYTLPCAGCGPVIFETTSWWPTGTFRRNLADRGWTLKGKRITCPTCTTSQKEAREAERKATIMDKTTTSTPALTLVGAAEPNAQPSDAARAVKRQIMHWLDEAYDTAAQHYRPGFSDASVARETSAAEAHVAKLREEFYGPAAPPMPPEIAAIATALNKQILQIEERKAERRKALDDIADTLERDHTDASKAFAELKRTLDQVIAANGWRA